MGRFIEAADRHQSSLLPACRQDYVDADDTVRVIDAFVDELDLAELGFERVQPASTDRPVYDPGMMLKRYVCG
jgi:transposase